MLASLPIGIYNPAHPHHPGPLKAKSFVNETSPNKDGKKKQVNFFQNPKPIEFSTRPKTESNIKSYKYKNPPDKPLIEARGGRKTRKYNKKNRKYRKKSQKKKITSNRKIKKKIKSRKKKYNKLLIRN